MTKVFIGGSRRVSVLNAQVGNRLDNIIQKELPVVIGDANGVDKAVQRYLQSRCYRNVEVFCSQGLCRNNLGEWRIRNVPAEGRGRDFAFYSAKDRAMTQEATVGFMVWDGASIGTLLNVFRLIKQQKKVVVYTVPDMGFQELKNGVAEWESFASRFDAKLRQRVEERANQEACGRKTTVEASFRA